MEQINVKVEAQDGQLVVRTGQALPLQEPTKINYTGELPSVRRYLEVHGADGSLNNKDTNPNYVHPERAMIVVDRGAMSIALETDVQSAYSHKITGKLELSDELKRFEVNPQGNVRTREALVKLLRFNKRFFKNQTQYEEILKAYQAFNVKTSGKLSASSDTRGNKDIAYKKELESNLPTEFFLNIPVFKGYDPAEFSVEICMDVTEHEARFWFESPVLAEMIDVESRRLLDEEVKPFEKHYVVVYK